MNFKEADSELIRRVKKYRFNHPHTSYETAAKIVLNDDPALADAYSGVPNQRAVLIEQQFALDRELRDENNVTRDITEYQYRCNVAQVHGWRWAAALYGLDLEKEIKEKIQREILDLETKQILYQKPFPIIPKKKNSN